MDLVFENVHFTLSYFEVLETALLFPWCARSPSLDVCFFPCLPFSLSRVWVPEKGFQIILSGCPQCWSSVGLCLLTRLGQRENKGLRKVWRRALKNQQGQMCMVAMVIGQRGDLNKATLPCKMQRVDAQEFKPNSPGEREHKNVVTAHSLSHCKKPS